MVALSNCMVIGDRRKYLAMVVSLKCEMDLETGGSTDKLARYFLLSPITMQLERATIWPYNI